jgi:hypothetical protein
MPLTPATKITVEGAAEYADHTDKGHEQRTKLPGSSVDFVDSVADHPWRPWLNL